MNWINRVIYNYPTKGDYEFQIIPSIVIGQDEILNDDGTSHYIGFSWLFWGIYYYFK